MLQVSDIQATDLLIGITSKGSSKSKLANGNGFEFFIKNL